MGEPGRSGGKKAVSSPHFLSNLLLIVLGITYYVALSHLSAIGAVLRRGYQVIWPFVLAFVMAWLLNPVMRFFEEKVFCRCKHGRRGLSITVTYVLVLALIGALLSVILPQVYDSLVALVDKVPGYLKGLRTAITELAGRFRLLDTENASFIVDTYTKLVTSLTTWVQSVLPQVVDASVTIGSSIVNTLMALIASIYMLADKERLKRLVKKCLMALLPEPYDEKTLDVLRRSNHIFSSFIDGKLLDSLIIGILCFIGTLLLRIPFAGLISLVVGVTNVIPFFGPFIGAIPCLLILLIVDPWSSLWFLIFIIALQQLDGNVIGPRILGESTGVSALGVLVSITVGGSLGGVVGMLVGVPVYAILYVLLREYFELRLTRKKARREQKEAQAAAGAPAPEEENGPAVPDAAPARESAERKDHP